jgi:hypothetical protein
MSTQTRARLETLAVIIALLAATLSGVKSWVLIPDRLDRAEARMTEIERVAIEASVKRGEDRDILLRMSWNYEQVTKDIASINKKLDSQAGGNNGR